MNNCGGLAVNLASVLRECGVDDELKLEQRAR